MKDMGKRKISEMGLPCFIFLVQHFLNKGVEKEAGKQYIRKRP
jgi:hypothetical protein